MDTLSACACSAVALDFERKVVEPLSFAEAVRAMNSGRFVWIDLCASDPAEARRLLAELRLLDADVIEQALSNEPSTQHARYDGYLHVVVSGCRARGAGFELARVDVVIADSLFLTIHRDQVEFLAATWRDYKSDFVRFARSPSFLLYEVWDHLLDSYLALQKSIEHRVEALQAELRSDTVDDRVFSRLSELGADLLHFRKIVLPARTVLSDLATRRSLFVSEATQGFLANMAGTVEHVLQDLLVDRDILSEALNLHMSLVGHRTNQVMKKLTVVSVVFLPLSFLAGVYGMNFTYLPEINWRYGYAYFWLAASLVVAAILGLLRRTRLL
jgi:magnesium transporter